MTDMTSFDETQHPRAHDGTFAEKSLSAPEVVLGALDVDAEQLREDLKLMDAVHGTSDADLTPDYYSASRRLFGVVDKLVNAPREQHPVNAGDVGPGDVVDLQTNTSPSPFDWHLNRNRDLRISWKNAGRPRALTVLSTRPDPEEPGDTLITFDLDGSPVELSFYGGNPLLTTKADA